MNSLSPDLDGIPTPPSDSSETDAETVDKKTYCPPALDRVGSIPHLTGGSDFFGDMRSRV